MRLSSSIDLGLPAELDVRYWFSFWVVGWLKDAAATAAFFRSRTFLWFSRLRFKFPYCLAQESLWVFLFLIILFLSEIFEIIFKSTTFLGFCISSVSLTNFQSNSNSLWQIFTVWSGYDVREDGVGTGFGDSSVFIFDDAVFAGCGGSDDIILVFSIVPDDGAFDSKFIVLCFFTFFQ